MKSGHRFLSLFPLILFLAAACAHYPVNSFLKQAEPDQGYRLKKMKENEKSDRLLLVLTFSGGGTRAASLAYGVMEELAQTAISLEGRKKTLLEEIDILSGVSGGSVIAAYYGLFGNRLFADFEWRFLKKDIQSELIALSLAPRNWFRMWDRHFSRSDLLAEYFDRELFDGRTFGDMAGRNGPMILINATDVTLGSHFTFSQDLFDLLCSDLSRFPVARAVAASAAVPIVLSPITLYNYAGSCSYREPEWIQKILEDPSAPKRRHLQALQKKSYMDARKKPYIHLVDGGISDNLGLRAVIDQLLAQGEPWPSLKSLGLENVRKIVFITVNAEKEPDQHLDQWDRTLRSDKVATSILRIPMARYNFETVQLVRETLKNWAEEIKRQRCQAAPGRESDQKSAAPAPCGDIQSYTIEVDPDSLPDPAERAYFNNLPTSFHLPAETVDKIRFAARRILSQSPEFQRLLRELRP